MELPTTISGTVFRQATTSRADTAQPTVPPAGCTVDYSQEFGGPDETQYPVSDTSGLARSHRSLTNGSRTSGSEYESARDSISNEDGDQTIQTSQHDLGPQQGLGTSPTQPPNPTQPQDPTVGKDRLATRNLRQPSTLENTGYSLFVEDAFWSTPDVSRDTSNQSGELSAKELQEISDQFQALEMAKEEFRCSSSGLSTPLGTISASGSSSPGLNPPQNAPELPKYAPKEWRDELLSGHLTRAGRAIRPGTTPPATPAADPSGLTAATSAGPTVDTPACTPA